jgi:hypothetical protein
MVVFYHEFNSLSSGAAVLITNLAKGLLDNGREVLLINFIGGPIHKELGRGRKNLRVANGDKASIRKVSAELTSDDIIITTHFYKAYRYFKKPDPRILFICVNTTSLVEANRFFGKINFQSFTRKLIADLKKCRGIIFGDEYALWQNAETFDLKQKEFDILPIPVVVPHTDYHSLHKENAIADGTVHFTYVGRAVDWKIFPVRKILKDLASIQSEGSKVVLSIITDDQDEFRSRLPLVPDNVKLEFYENLSPTKLNKLLKEEADLHFAMGTSALEGAKLGIPTILIDLGYSDFPNNYRYKFVHQTPPTFIGTDACKISEFSGMTMQELLRLIKDKESLDKISEECFVYIKSNHELGVITRQLESYISNCNCHISNIKKHLIRYWL